MIITDYKHVSQLLKDGNVGLVPADTVYGISCLTSNKEGVERIYEIKGRDKDKPFILLLPAAESLLEFGIDMNNAHLKQAVEKYWPGPTSLIIECPDETLTYLHRGKKSLAFRVPNKLALLDLLKETGPIVSTSANISDNNTVITAQEAQKTFGDLLDFYLDGGEMNGSPSRVVRITENGEVLIRE
jgi:L-threonylcarbamoyladenylate synthase